jgi:hypothetical protein
MSSCISLFLKEGYLEQPPIEEAPSGPKISKEMQDKLAAIVQEVNTWRIEPEDLERVKEICYEAQDLMRPQLPSATEEPVLEILDDQLTRLRKLYQAIQKADTIIEAIEQEVRDQLKDISLKVKECSNRRLSKEDNDEYRDKVGRIKTTRFEVEDFFQETLELSFYKSAEEISNKVDTMQYKTWSRWIPELLKKNECLQKRAVALDARRPLVRNALKTLDSNRFFLLAKQGLKI